jgi:hypothetical protein
MADYYYLSKAGNVVECYGEVCDNSNFEVVCGDEWNDWTCLGCSADDWEAVCRYVEKRTPDVLEICAC